MHASWETSCAYTNPSEAATCIQLISKLGGGWGIFVGFFAALVVASNSFFVKDIFRHNDAPWGILAGAVVIVAVGVADDILDIRWWIKLLGQAAAAFIVAIWGVCGCLWCPLFPNRSSLSLKLCRLCSPQGSLSPP